NQLGAPPWSWPSEQAASTSSTRRSGPDLRSSRRDLGEEEIEADRYGRRAAIRLGAARRLVVGAPHGTVRRPGLAYALPLAVDRRGATRPHRRDRDCRSGATAEVPLALTRP